MARGGYGSGSGVPLGERVRRGPTSVLGTPPPDGCPARHVWVLHPADHAGHRRPGLLVEWRQRDGAWEGLVTYAAALRGSGWSSVTEWLPADQLEPA